jgi:translation elongation factor EF-1alpha
MDTTKILILSMVGLLLVSVVSGYICINPDDNNGVKEFKIKINTLALEQEITKGITPEAFQLKVKYFGPCTNG